MLRSAIDIQGNRNHATACRPNSRKQTITGKVVSKEYTMQASSRHITSSNTASIIDLLAEQGARIDTQDKLKRTPLKLATLGYGYNQHCKTLAIHLVGKGAEYVSLFCSLKEAQHFFGDEFDRITDGQRPEQWARPIKKEKLFGV